MVPPGDDGELLGDPVRPALPLREPVLDDKLPGESMGRHSAVAAELLLVRHGEPHPAHTVGEGLDLTCECGAGLSRIVGSGEPDREATRIVFHRQYFSYEPLHIAGHPLVPQPPGHRCAVGHVTPQRQPIVGVPVVLSPDEPSGLRQTAEGGRLMRGRCHGRIKHALCRLAID